MKYKRKSRIQQILEFGLNFNVSDKTDEDDETGGGGNVRNPEKLLERYNASKADLKQTKSALKELETRLQEIENQKKTEEEKRLSEDRNWQELLERKEKQFQADLAKAVEQRDNQIKELQTSLQTAQQSAEEVKQQFEQTQSQLKSFETKQGVMDQIRGELDPSADLDYFWFRHGKSFSTDPEKGLQYGGKPFTAETFKSDPQMNVFLRKNAPEGSGTNPGHDSGDVGKNNKAPTNSKPRLPMSLLSDHVGLQDWMQSNGIKPAEFNGMMINNKFDLYKDGSGESGGE
jgi:hypothetical protein